jgi:hypothetical protein
MQRKAKLAAFAAVLVLCGLAFAQIMPGGNRGPRNTVVPSGGGDFWVAGKIPVADNQGRPHQTLDGLFRIFKETGQVEAFIIAINPDGSRTGRWVPAVDVAGGQ